MYSSIVRWEVWYDNVESGKSCVGARSTREGARIFMRTIKKHPELWNNARMYKVVNLLIDGEPVSSTYERAR